MGTGVCINAVAPNARSLSSSYAFLAYNLLGYASAPLICGWTADGWGLIWGWRIVVLMSVVTMLLLVWAWQMAKNSHVRRSSTPTLSDGVATQPLLNTSPPVSSIEDASDQALAAQHILGKSEERSVCDQITVAVDTMESLPSSESQRSTTTACDGIEPIVNVSAVEHSSIDGGGSAAAGNLAPRVHPPGLIQP